jgi:TetR/AcrR family transcriptional regulator
MPQVAVSARRSDTRDRILETALDEFADRGFEGASARQITARAGVNHGLIAYYFGSKKKLWQAAVDHAFGDMQAQLETALDGAPETNARERAARVIREHVRYVARHPAFVRLMYEEGKRRGERMRWIVDRHVKPLYDVVAEMLRKAGRPNGLPAEISSAHLFYALAGASGLIFHQAEECRRVSGVDPFDPVEVDHHIQVIEWLLLGAADPEAKEVSR